MRMLRPSCAAGILLPTIANLAVAVDISGENVEDCNQLRRKRIELPKAPMNRLLNTGKDMEDIWEKASRTAQSEIEMMRLLNMHSPDMSMGSPSGDGPPARPPADTPSSPPDTGPTPPSVECLMGRTKEEYIFDLLEPITSSETLNDLSTPQGMAFDFLVNDDPGLEDPCASSTIEQRYGLVTLYFSTLGEETDNTGWLGAEQECTWYGVECQDGSTDATRLLLRKS
jgi:hypothetical protein